MLLECLLVQMIHNRKLGRSDGFTHDQIREIAADRFPGVDPFASPEKFDRPKSLYFDRIARGRRRTLASRVPLFVEVRKGSPEAGQSIYVPTQAMLGLLKLGDVPQPRPVAEPAAAEIA